MVYVVKSLITQIAQAEVFGLYQISAEVPFYFSDHRLSLGIYN